MKITTQIMNMVVVLGLISIISCSAEIEIDANEHDPAEIAIGERLFLETRFAQAYYANPGKADPALQYTLTMDQP